MAGRSKRATYSLKSGKDRNIHYETGTENNTLNSQMSSEARRKKSSIQGFCPIGFT